MLKMSYRCSSRMPNPLVSNNQPVLPSKTTFTYHDKTATAAKDPQLMECISSWLREIDINSIMDSPLLDVVVDALNQEVSFDSAVECISTMLRETRDVDEYLPTIEKLYPRILAVRPKIGASAAAEDADKLKGITTLFTETGEAWVVLLARMPAQFRPLVEAILECASRDFDREVINVTFNFWFELKQFLVMEKFMEARASYADLYSKLMDIMIRHLEFPRPESGNEKDLFDGDREQEDKFREFRHQMGDVLKDCCEVLGPSECLKKPYDLIEKWVHAHGSEAQKGRVPQWQSLEAPLFSMRAMGRMVDPDEKIMLPRLIPLITQIPDHEKVRFQAVMVLGRYTEWTAQHPDTLQDQLNFIIAAFDHRDKDVVQAAALALQFFCSDCATLLREYVAQLQQFYERVIHRLPSGSQHEVTEGVAAVVAVQPLDSLYQQFKFCADPIIHRLKLMAQNAVTEPQKLELADHIKLISIFVQKVQPYVKPGQPHPAVQYCQEMFPTLAQLVDVFIEFPPILERVCHCWRRMILSYRSDAAPLLPALAEKLASGFEASKQGCFLWATDAIVQESSLGAEGVDQQTTDQVFQFAERQITTALRTFNGVAPEELPDIIEDFYRFASSLVLYFPTKMLSSPLIQHVLSAASSSMAILKEEPLIAILQFLRDFLAYAGPYAPTSVSFPDRKTDDNPPEIQAAVKQLILLEGKTITQRVMTGMMYNFPQDCFPDASGVLLAMFQHQPEAAFDWTRATLEMVPEGSLTNTEKTRLLGNISSKLATESDIRGVRTIMQDFTTSYRRRNITPRDGLGRLEATRFRFSG